MVDKRKRADARRNEESLLEAAAAAFVECQLERAFARSGAASLKKLRKDIATWERYAAEARAALADGPLQ